MNKYVLIVAGGKGLRMGGDLPKQFIPLHGKPVLMHTVEQFFRYNNDLTIILVLPEDHQPYWRMLCKELNFTIPHLIASGGKTRFHSVRNGLAAVVGTGLIAVHDGVRPFVSADVIAACFDTAQQTGACVPSLPITDSIRERQQGSSLAVDRSRFCTVQTPQVFHSELLQAAYQQPYSDIFTDDASVVEATGGTITLVDGNHENIKITTPFDLLVSEILCAHV